MSETGLVAVFTGVRRPFELREFPVPAPEPGDIVVKIRLANVCGSDLHAWRGEYDISRGQAEPFCLSIGHEMAGEVASLLLSRMAVPALYFMVEQRQKRRAA